MAAKRGGAADAPQVAPQSGGPQSEAQAPPFVPESTQPPQASVYPAPASPPPVIKPYPPPAPPPQPPPQAPPQAPPLQTDGLAAQMSGLMGGGRPTGQGPGGGNPLADMDFTGVPDAGRTLLLPTDDPCEFEVKKVTLERAKTGAKAQMLVVEMVSTFPTGYEGVKVWDQLSFEPTALWKMKSFLSACGMLENGRFTGRSYQDLAGYVVRAVVFHDTYQGRQKNKIAGGYEEAYQTPGLATAATTGAPAPPPASAPAPGSYPPPPPSAYAPPPPPAGAPDWPQPQ